MTERRLSHKRPAALDRFYYGATYYPEHWSAEDREDDAERMADAGFNVVRMGEFAWDYMEPTEGTHRFDIFDETIARLGDAGVDTILCTPTATPPRWLTMARPEVLRVDADGRPMQHGSRQHVCPTGETFRAYSREITQAMADHFAENEHVVGWQTDNELNCHFAECHCASCQTTFQAWLRETYGGDIDALNATWGNAFWSLTYSDFAEVPTPKVGKPAYPNPSHQLDYYRFISWSVTRFQREQIDILRAANSDWWVTHNGIFRHIDYRGPFTEDLDVLGYDVYPFFDWDPDHRPFSQAFNLDHARAFSGNVIVPEQQSGPGGQAPYLHDTPEPKEVRRMVYTSVARGADSLLFFRWRTCRFGAEEYWCGVLDHDNVKRRRYDEVSTIGGELKKVAPEVMGTHVRVDVGIAAADVDVYDAHDTMSFGLPSPKEMAESIHSFFLKRGYAVGCVHPADDLSDLKVYIIPHWALFNPDWVDNLTAYVEGGGILVIGARTATKDWHNNVVAETPPGVLSDLAGVRIAEYGRQNAPDKRPLKLRFYPNAQKATSEHWYEMLEPRPGTLTIARWQDRHLKLKPAALARMVGDGIVVYVGTYLTEGLMEALLPQLVDICPGLAPVWPQAPDGIQVVVRENDERRLWFLINVSDKVQRVSRLPAGTELLSGATLEEGKPAGSRGYIQANDVRVVKQELLPAIDGPATAQTDSPAEG